MDRIYVNNSADEELFKEYAIKKGFYYKSSQSHSSEGLMFGNKFVTDSYDNMIMVYLDEYKVDYDYYPYMDTLMYYRISDSLLTNFDVDEDGKEFFYDYLLDETNGLHDCSMCDGNERVECPECEGGDNLYDCDLCGGDGTFTCDFCNNEAASCPDCDGSYPDCEFCEGEPVECPECGGEIPECYQCNGSGKAECDMCRDTHLVSCPECRDNE